MIDETQGAGWAQEPNAANTPPTPNAADTIGYCQDCGRPLSRETIRTVGSGVFCEPCLEIRLGTPGQPQGTAGSSVPPTGNPVPPPASGFGSMPPIPGEPSPTLAGLLGMIPGVGAMYNGQFAKGIAHLLIFAFLVSLSNNVSDIFGLLVAGWVFYQIFDAIHTARARRDGTPLPNMFGLNDIGERVGVHWNAMQQQQRPQPTPPPAQPTQTQAPTAANWPPAPVPAPTQANWAGYVPPTAFGTPYTAPTPTPPAVEQQPYQAPHNAAPGYANTFTGDAGTPIPNAYPNAMPPAPPVSRFPISAIWLIGLGLVFLVPGIHISDQWVPAIVLFIAAAASFYRRLSDVSVMRATTGADNNGYLIRCMRGPVVLLTLAVLFALQALHLASFEKSWPFLLIVFGVFIGAGRLTTSSAGTIPPQAPPQWNPPTHAPATEPHPQDSPREGV